jgi:hypothetical protein
MIKISKYGHSFIIGIFALWTPIAFDSIAGYFASGAILGMALRLARQSGQESEDE